MAGRTVQFSNFATTYHDYYRSQSSSPDSTPYLSVPSEQLTPRHSSVGNGVTPPTLVSGVETGDRTPRVHNHYSGAPSSSTSTSSLSPGPHAPHYPLTTQSRTLSLPQPTGGVMGPSLNVHKVLRHSLIPSINYNLLFSDESAIGASPELTSRVLAEAASIPPVSSIIISCVGLPWHITITSKSKKHNATVTVGDVLHKLYRELRQGVEMSDAHYRSLPTAKQVILKKAFDSRCELLPEGEERTREHEKGLKCVDYLNMNTRFLGFVYIGEVNGGDHWKLEVASPYQRSSSIVEESASDTSWQQPDVVERVSSVSPPMA